MAESTWRFISCNVMAESTWRFISCHVKAGCNHRFISCHDVVRSGLPTVYDGYMVWHAVDFGIWYNYFDTYGYGAFHGYFITWWLYMLYDWFYGVYSSNYSFLNILSAKLLSMIYILLDWVKLGFVKCF